MSALSCLIIDDEPLAAKILTDYIAQVPFLALQRTCRDAIEATDHLRSHPVDLLFLDIHLPKLTGINFLKTLRNRPAVILTTAYHQYAIDGFDLNVTDYLLKPISFERFLVAVGKVPLPTPAAPLPDPSPPKEYLFVTVQKKKVRVLLADITYIESQREYVKVVTTQATYLTKLSTHEIEALLPPDRFRRVHRSFIVSVDKIEAFTAEALDIGGVSIPIGRAYRDATGWL
jgi:two-component system, LytTR family, response regulator